MQSFVIEGGRPLSGTVRAAGNKNGALPILAATVLASGPVLLENVPRIRDVETMVRILADLGAEAEWTGPNEVSVDATHVAKTELDPDLGREIRASFLLAGPLLARFGRATVPPPGGDVIGRRRLDTHIHAFMELGVEVELNGAYDLRADRLRGKRMFLDEASVMATENAVMAAVLAEGETIVGHAACEPHIQDLCHFLVALGAQIDGIGSNMLRITGVDELRGGAHRIRPEHVEVASFAALAASTGGDVTIEDVEPDDLILDIGPTSVAVLKTMIARAGTIVWNGPVGVFEFDAFANGTRDIAQAIADSQAFSIAGGGDTLAAIAKYGLADRIGYISTGGGAFLEFVEGKTLPAVAMLESRARQ